MNLAVFQKLSFYHGWVTSHEHPNKRSVEYHIGTLFTDKIKYR